MGAPTSTFGSAASLQHRAPLTTPPLAHLRRLHFVGSTPALLLEHRRASSEAPPPSMGAPPRALSVAPPPPSYGRTAALRRQNRRPPIGAPSSFIGSTAASMGATLRALSVAPPPSVGSTAALLREHRRASSGAPPPSHGSISSHGGSLVGRGAVVQRELRHGRIRLPRVAGVRTAREDEPPRSAGLGHGRALVGGFPERDLRPRRARRRRGRARAHGVGCPAR